MKQATQQSLVSRLQHFLAHNLKQEPYTYTPPKFYVDMDWDKSIKLPLSIKVEESLNIRDVVKKFQAEQGLEGKQKLLISGITNLCTKIVISTQSWLKIICVHTGISS